MMSIIGEMRTNNKKINRKKCNKTYWDSNIDPRNLGDASVLRKFDWGLEKAFYLSSEQQYAYEKAGILRGKKVLELGAGMGVNVFLMAQKGASVVALDLSEERLKWLSRLAHDLNIEQRILPVCGEAEQLPCAPGSVDLIYTKSVLIHTDLEQAIMEIHRVLSGNGVGIFIEPTVYNPLVNLYRRFFAPKEWKTITTYFDDRRIAMLRHHFDMSSVKRFYFISFLAFFFQFGIKSLALFRISLALLGFLDTILFSVFPFLKRLCWFAVFTVRKKTVGGKNVPTLEQKNDET